MTNKYLDKITEETALDKKASAWLTAGRIIKKIGNKAGARPMPKVGPAAPPNVGDKIRSFGKDVVSGKGRARLALGATGGALVAGVAAGRMSKKDESQ